MSRVGTLNAVLESLESRRLFAGAISGHVRLDVDHNGTADEPLGAVTVYLDGNSNDKFDEGEPIIFTQGSDGDHGGYIFENLAPGTYRVRLQPAHIHRTYEPSANNGAHIITITGDETISNADFAVYPVSAVGGVVYHDANGDGVFTYNNPIIGPDGKTRPGAGDDPLIVGATAYLDLDHNQSYTLGEPTCVTRDFISYFGQNYNFNQLDPNTYTVRLKDLPAGYNGPTPDFRQSTVAAGEETKTDNFAFTTNTPPPPAGDKTDFNDDGRNDLLFRSGGTTTFWAMNGAKRLSAGTLQAPPAAWSLGAAADFNGDGHTDVVYHNNVTGESRIWIHNSITSSQQINLPTLANADWRIVAAGDFNQDDHNDIVWRNSVTGRNTLWLMDGTRVGSFRALPSTANQQWAVSGVGDFNGDGIDDIVWRNGTTGRNTLWLLNDQQRIAAFKALDYSGDLNWSIAGVSDYDNDGDPDLFWRNATTGRNLLWTYSGTQRIGFVGVVL